MWYHVFLSVFKNSSESIDRLNIRLFWTKHNYDNTHIVWESHVFNNEEREKKEEKPLFTSFIVIA